MTAISVRIIQKTGFVQDVQKDDFDEAMEFAKAYSSQGNVESVQVGSIVWENGTITTLSAKRVS